MCFRGRSGALLARHTEHSEEFLTLKTPLLSINAPFIFPSNSRQWEHNNGSVPFLNKSSDNPSPRTSLFSIPYRTSFVWLEGWHFPKLFHYVPILLWIPKAHSSSGPQVLPRVPFVSGTRLWIWSELIRHHLAPLRVKKRLSWQSKLIAYWVPVLCQTLSCKYWVT